MAQNGNMTTKSCITGPFRPQKRPRKRVLAPKAYVVFATFGALGYLFYLVVAG